MFYQNHGSITLLESMQQNWETRATVRHKPRIVFDKNQTGTIYPLSLQPLCIHPKVMALGQKELTYLLVQSFYKYQNDIDIIETKHVNQVLLAITADNICGLTFNQQQKLCAYTIMVDESYHAYVAFDAMLQIEQNTGIKPLPLPKIIEIEYAIEIIKDTLQSEYHDIFTLIAICLAENTLTKDMLSILNQHDTHPFIQRVIQDHVSDETRHAGIFFNILQYVWLKITDEYKYHIASVLVDFLCLYLDRKIQIGFDRTVLTSLGLHPDEADEILNDTYASFQLTRHHPMLKNILCVLSKAGVMDEFVCPYFKHRGWF